MSSQQHHEQNQEHEHDHEQDDAQLGEEDIVEVVEDEGEGYEPMDDDDDDNDQYDGEIIIGGPGPGEEDMVMDEEGEMREDNSWGANALHASQQSIFTVSLHPSFPNPPLAVTGGEDDTGFLYCPIPSDPDADASSSSSTFNSDNFPPTKLTGHSDSVVATGWNFDGEMVATGGMDGKVRVWRGVKNGSRRGSQEAVEDASKQTVDDWKHWEFLTSLDTGSEITWLQWHPKGNVLAAGCEDATVWMWNLPSGNTLAVLSSHTLSSTSGIFPPPLGRQLLTTSLDSTLILWDPRTSVPIWKSSIFTSPNSTELDPSEHGITSLAVSPNGQIASVGSSSGKVKLINLTNGSTLNTLIGHNEGESIEALAFVDLLNGAAGGGKGVVCISGATDGKGFVWDVNTGRVRAELHHDEPITSIATHPAPFLHQVTTGSADSTLKTWDIRTGTLLATHKGHVGVVNGVAVAPIEGGQAIVSAGDEGVSLVWKL